MILSDSFCCILGKNLHGIGKDIRYKGKEKTDERVLIEYNDNYLVLKDNCECKIINQNIKLSDQEYSNCLKKLRNAGYKPYDNINIQLQGRRIFCEFSKKPKKLNKTRRQEVVISSKIAVGVISCEEVKSGIYSMSQRWVTNPNNLSK